MGAGGVELLNAYRALKLDEALANPRHRAGVSTSLVCATRDGDIKSLKPLSNLMGYILTSVTSLRKDKCCFGFHECSRSPGVSSILSNLPQRRTHFKILFTGTIYNDVSTWLLTQKELHFLATYVYGPFKP
jgi:hypothetical protein